MFIYECNFANCDLVFYSNESLGYHINRHTGTKPYKCTVAGCNERFYSKPQRELHENKDIHQFDDQNIKQESNYYESIIKIEPTENDELMIKSENMNVDVKMKNGNGNEMVKKVKKKRKRNKRGMGKRIYKCNFCGQILSNSVALDGHVNNHKGIKPYRCLNNGCSRQFASRSGLTTHSKKCVFKMKIQTEFY